MTRTALSARDNRTAVDKAMALLNAFGEQATTGVGVSELARRADLSKSTAFRLLASLQNNDAVERAGNAYRLGRMIQDLGTTQESDLHARLRDALTPYLVNLYELTRQTVHLAVLQGTDVVYLNKLYGQLTVRSPSRIGGRAPSYCTAVGKILLAYDPSAASRAMDEEMHAWTANTITDPDLLARELAMVQRNNLAFDREEILMGLNCVAAPVFSTSGQVVAALSVSGPVGKFDPESQMNVLRRVCYEASRAASAVSAAVSRGM
ncbi:IclR family transcriptional regulator [Glutamicibacter protophormiae]|uniref:DNA-binding IclR family transcriptional regulator n=1 Tax=Glutamicibacter protophormiae TaxID=37930 RepID=A0ABS4XLJ0_GLUPR|nr:IclR family transcriptional regulator [Glutamicibacter protophormiae]MBP2397245.1 DNA-binding IclR family transcriptional regulator [Glutamicibacter protophormiae]WPR64068.1 IclR family transcriptional regulator [Glutamicibacter protophormiae]WPR67562.1 IclR family transcriptional regulator [Glutamicibacter protophormiae]GGL80728.1 IclR family transcriptional regulator [Glutamicibacter protophormiae]